MAIHNILLTPRLAPTPYDPPNYTPIVDKNKMLSAYRRIRDAYLKELDRHKETRKQINHTLERVRECKETGVERMGKMRVAREKQDKYMKEWQDLEKVQKAKIKEMKRDISELQTELRQLKHDVKYEYSLRDTEERILEKKEEEIVLKERELELLVRDVQGLNQENLFLHKTSATLDKALTSNKEIAEDNEERLQKVSEELGLTEIDVFMLQRNVKVAEEEARKWRQRFLMAEKDIRRAEKLLKDFTKSKSNELEAQGGLVSSSSGCGGWGSLNSPMSRSVNSGASFRSSRGKRECRVSVSGGGQRQEGGGDGESGRRKPKKKSGRRGTEDTAPGLSQLARGFNSVDELMGGSPSSTFMKAVLSGDNDLASASTKKSRLALSPLGKQLKERRRKGGSTTEIAEGMEIDAHDTYHDIAVKNNRRSTAKARSYAGSTDLWPESLMN